MNIDVTGCRDNINRLADNIVDWSKTVNIGATEIDRTNAAKIVYQLLDEKAAEEARLPQLIRSRNILIGWLVGSVLVAAGILVALSTIR